MSTNPQESVPSDGAEAHKQAKTQLKIGFALMAVTIVAVGTAFLPIGRVAVTIAIVINAFLVAGLSMHLKSEKKTITQFLIFTVIFTGVLFALTALAYFDSTAHHH